MSTKYLDIATIVTLVCLFAYALLILCIHVNLRKAGLTARTQVIAGLIAFAFAVADGVIFAFVTYLFDKQ